MHRIWGLEYDIAVLTNITQDHLDLHWTMEDYVNTKLEIFKKLITNKRKPWIKKTAIINIESDYSDLFTSETYDSLYTYWKVWNANLRALNINQDINKTEFEVTFPAENLKIETTLKWDYNIDNILAAIWVFVALGIKKDVIKKIIEPIKWIPWRLEEIQNLEWLNIFIDYAHTPDALEKVLETLRKLRKNWKIITVFWATWDRDRSKRPIMWKIVSNLSDKVILTEDDNYSEDINEIIADILPWIDRIESTDDFWIIINREEAITNALLTAKKWDIVLITWKWDEHVMMTNKWPIDWHDKTIVETILKWLDDNKIM